MINFLSADPGKTGALAAMTTECQLLEVIDMPILTRGSIDYIDVVEIMQFCDKYDIEQAVIEKVGSKHTDSKQAIFTFGENTGALKSAIAAICDKIHYLPPQKWKRAIGIAGKDKKQSAIDAGAIYGNEKFQGPRGGWKDGRGDAVLMGLCALKLKMIK